jgi:hypothetical protein
MSKEQMFGLVDLTTMENLVLSGYSTCWESGGWGFYLLASFVDGFGVLPDGVVVVGRLTYFDESWSLEDSSVDVTPINEWLSDRSLPTSSSHTQIDLVQEIGNLFLQGFDYQMYAVG